MHGESWKPILKGKSKGRNGFLYEYYKENEYRPTGGFGGTPIYWLIDQKIGNA